MAIIKKKSGDHGNAADKGLNKDGAQPEEEIWWGLPPPTQTSANEEEPFGFEQIKKLLALVQQDKDVQKNKQLKEMFVELMAMINEDIAKTEKMIYKTLMEKS